MRIFRHSIWLSGIELPTSADLSAACGTMVCVMTKLYFDQFDSQVGLIGVLAGPAGVREVGWRLQQRGASTEPDEMVQMALGQLREYFAGQRREFTLPLDLPPMDQVAEAVLQALRTVGYGKTITYAELAQLSGTGVPARAIGEIMAANPVPIIIPCHRVVASDGLGGYSGGEPGRQIETKRWLLENEGALPPALV
jgi:methylated-DNA-[protein]-cysteine S-methyltransferase